MFCGGEDLRCGMYEHPNHMWHECSSVPHRRSVRLYVGAALPPPYLAAWMSGQLAYIVRFIKNVPFGDLPWEISGGEGL